MFKKQSQIYHERQYLWRCGLHAVNALLRSQVYTAQDLDVIADSLLTHSTSSLRHPHRAPFRLGDYDANVLIVALGKLGFQTNWFSSQNISLAETHGFLINRAAKSGLLWTGRRHWIAIVRYEKSFYLVDSQLLKPVLFQDDHELWSFFDTIRKDGGHVLIVNKGSRTRNEENPTKNKKEGNE